MHFIVEGFVDLCSVVLTLDHYSGSGTGSYYYMPHKTTSCTGTYFVVVVGFVDLVRGADPGSTITAGLEVVGKIFGEDVNKEITKVPTRMLPVCFFKKRF